jgi:uncharacterized protein YggU (UPF0235/DUF167 family)
MASINLRVTPSASRDAVMGWRGDVLRLRVAAPAQRGKANDAVLRLLAAALGIERRRLRIIRYRERTVRAEALAPTLSAGPGSTPGAARRRAGG